jgi:hypothetical protein
MESGEAPLSQIYRTDRDRWSEPQHYHVPGVSLRLAGPSDAILETPSRFCLAVLRENVDERVSGQLEIRSTDAQALLPAMVVLGPDGEGTDDDEASQFEVTFRSPGIHTVSLRDRASGLSVTSNQVSCTSAEGAPEQRLYWGDFHWHTAFTDGRRRVGQVYQYARDAMGLDFAGCTDHDPNPEMWQKLCDAVDEFHDPGRFVTLYGYEWTAHDTGQGHKNVYFREKGPPAFECSRRNPDSPYGYAEALWAALESLETDALTIPHHSASAWFPVPWSKHHERFQPLVEIYSIWGSSECWGGPRTIRYGRVQPAHLAGHSVRDALGRGLRLGFVAGSDSHNGRCAFGGGGRDHHDADYGSREEPLYPGGITGVWAPELTRDAIWDALRARRCYATTGSRIRLHFTLNDVPMGSSCTLTASDAPRHVKVEVWGTAPIARIDLIKNGVEFKASGGEQGDDGMWHTRFEYVDEELVVDTDYYYARVIQADAELAWSSPVWVSCPT